MATEIQWTDETWNPVTGCTKVSPGCAHCYAEGVAARFWAKQYPPARAFDDVRVHMDRLDQPKHWQKPRRVFVNSMSDLFHEQVPYHFISFIWRTMQQTPQHTYQILTKRARRMLHEVPSLVSHFGVLPNVWLGVSVENQHFADERIPLLLQTPAAVRFISAEPLLGPVDLWGARYETGPGRFQGAVTSWKPSLDWVIVGGESGPKSRPFDVAWGRSIVAACKAAGVPVFMKQLGACVQIADSPLSEWPSSIRLISGPDGGMGRRIGLQDRKGGNMNEWPEDLRVREFPQVSSETAVSE